MPDAQGSGALGAQGAAGVARQDTSPGGLLPALRSWCNVRDQGRNDHPPALGFDPSAPLPVLGRVH